MHLTTSPHPLNSIHLSSKPLFLTLPFKCKRRRRPTFIASSSSSSSPSNPEGFSWLQLSQSIRRGSERFLNELSDSVKKETGFDFEDAKLKVVEFSGRAVDSAKSGQILLQHFQSELFPEFLNWNKFESWKDIKKWDSKRVGVFILYVIVTVFSCQKICKAVRAPIINRERKELTEAYMEALIPEPTPVNVKRFKKGLWRKTTPKGLKLKKFIEAADGTLFHDSSYVGEDAWEDDSSSHNMEEVIDHDTIMRVEDKEILKENLGISGEFCYKPRIMF
ncbi:hypothetical protein FXO37_36836 [Capsicum annuum]|nr:hypothetical protein FXO37_36836 [Capsicum annuum]